MTRFVHMVLEGTKKVMIGGAFVFVAILLWGVFSRYVLEFAVAWVEELATALMIWLVFLGISVAANERGHIGLNTIRDLLPLSLRRCVILLSDLLIIWFLVVGVYQGGVIAFASLGQRTAALRLSYFWPYASIPVGSFLMLVQLVFVAIRDFRAGGREQQRDARLWQRPSNEGH